MQVPAEVAREAFVRLDTAARAYADAVVAYWQQRNTDPEGSLPSLAPLSFAHNALREAAQVVAAL